MPRLTARPLFDNRMTAAAAEIKLPDIDFALQLVQHRSGAACRVHEQRFRRAGAVREGTPLAFPPERGTIMPWDGLALCQSRLSKSPSVRLMHETPRG